MKSKKKSTQLSRQKLISKIDAVFATKVKILSNCTCARCGQRFRIEDVDCSHYCNRGNMPVRWDFDNCDTLCRPCHTVWEKDKNGAYREYKIKQLGAEKLEELELKSNQIADYSVDGLREILDKLQTS